MRRDVSRFMARDSWGAMTFRMLRPQTILSLCDGHGSWSQPYVDDDYDVIRVDLKMTGEDVRLFKLPSKRIWGVLAAPPCTVFAGSGNRWERTDDEMREGLSVVDACMRIIWAAQPRWWCLENPVGKLQMYLGPPRTCSPAHSLRPIHDWGQEDE